MTSLRLCTALLFAAAAASAAGAPGLAVVPPSSPSAWPERSSALPNGFSDSLVARVSAPTALAFLPDGTLLVARQPGELAGIGGGTPASRTVLDLGPRVCADRERGLLGVAVDPAFASNRFVYVYYTFKASGGCDLNSARSPVNRVSRFRLTPANLADPGSETVLIDNIPSPEGIHNGGDLHFGKDGLLYVSVGDGGCDYARPAVCAAGSDAARGFNNDAARDRHVLLGKILRITRDGGIPAGNPFQGATSARCAAAGRAAAGQTCREIYALGLRNPFRLAFDPDAPTTRFWINDVGQDVWEEVNEGRAGADYGWNLREGHCVVNSTGNCPPPPAGLTDPIYDYAHGTGCTAITAGAFVPDGVWPAEYDDDYLHGDFTCGKIFRLTPAANGGFRASEFLTGLGGNSVTGMSFGPPGSRGALYYMTYLEGGQIRRITHSGGGNRLPTAVARASPRSGPLPLTVMFDASGSSDPDGDRLTYRWEFGDGAASPNGKASHTYTTASTYVAVLTVRDGRGGEASETLRIDAGNSAPRPVILTPAGRARFRVGQTILLTGRATDPEEGRLTDGQLAWAVVLRHARHTHPFLSTGGNGVRFRAPAPESLAAAASSHLEVRLTATDSQGLTSTASRRLDPHRVSLVLATRPRRFQLAANGSWFRAPRTLRSWAGYGITVGTRSPQVDGSGRRWRFASWSNGGSRVHTIVTPLHGTRYTARFVRR